MMRAALGSTVVFLSALLVLAPPANGQTAPFDMAPEQSNDTVEHPMPAPSAGAPRVSSPERSPNMQPAPVESTPGAPIPSTDTRESIPTPAKPPFSSAPTMPSSTETQPPTTIQPEPQATSDPDEATRSASPTPTTMVEDFRRYIVPMTEFSLSGEVASRSWSVYLTPEQARSNAALRIAYQNAIFVAPEQSRLKVSINGRQVIDEAVSSPQGSKEVTATMPSGLLRAGANVISFRADMRHRTDCTIESTYDLWADIDPSRSYLTFGDGEASRLRRIEDIKAIGFDASGRTKFDLVVPSGDIAPATPSLIRLAEGLSLLARMPNQATTITSTPPQEARPGALTVLVGPSDELRALGATVPPRNGPIAEFSQSVGEGNGNTLVISGQNWNEIDSAIKGILEPNDRPAGQLRNSISQPSWRVPDAPLFRAEQSVSFADLGVNTQEFAGRRFRTDFTIAVPADFYAQAYGEMTILLDAGYTKAVLPGSHLDVYVNGNIATTVPIGSSDGTILQKFPISVTMHHLRPGVNDVALEANLVTNADAACLPGTNASGDSRFVLFDTSRLRFPDFARIGTQPSLPAFRGVGYPYNRAVESVPLVIADDGPEIASVAATLMGRLSMIAERPIPFTVQKTPFSVAGKDAIFVSVLPQTANGVLDHVGVDPEAKNVWGQNTTQAVVDDTRDTISRWRDQLGQEGWRHPLATANNWLKEKFDLSLADLRIAPRAQAAFVPPPASTLFVAQGIAPDSDAVWTLVSSPSLADLAAGVNDLTTQDGWGQLGGRVTSYTPSTGAYAQAPIGMERLVQSQPLSFANLRLVAANWLSTNVLSYATLLAITALVLGVATTALTSVLGRRE